MQRPRSASSRRFLPRLSRHARAAGAALAALLLGAQSGAQEVPPVRIAHQGRLLDAADAPVNGKVTLKFAVYADGDDLPGAPPKAPLWTATYDVQAFNGAYALELGDVSGGQPALPQDLLDPAADRWLGIGVQGGQEMRPRLRLNAVPVASLARRAQDSEKLSGQTLAQLDQRWAANDLAVKLSPTEPQQGDVAVSGKVAAADVVAGAVHVSGTVTAQALAGDGALLTNLDAAQLTGTVASDRVAGTYANALALTNPLNAFAGDGALLTNLDAAQLTGLVASDRLAGTYSNALALTNGQNAFAGTFAGDGAALTNLDATQLTGTVPGTSLAGTYPSAVQLTNGSNAFTGSFTGDGSKLTNLDATRLTGTLPGARLAGTYASAVQLTNTANTFTGAFTGNGAGLTNLDATKLTGSVPGAALAGTYGNALALTNTSNAFTGAFTGNGAGLTNLDATKLTGALPGAALTGTYANALALTNGANTIKGTFTGNGAGLTNLDAGQLTGTLASAAFGGTYARDLTFSGNVQFTGSVRLPVVASAPAAGAPEGTIVFNHAQGTVLVSNGTSWLTVAGRVEILSSGGTRSYSDGSYAASCKDYLTPNAPYVYSGAVGDGVYRIAPAGTPFDVYCDMTTDGGGWMLAAIPSVTTDIMGETAGLLDPSASAGVRNANLWDLASSSVRFTQLRLTDSFPAAAYRDIATFSGPQTIAGLLATNGATYSQSPVVTTSVTSNIGSTCFIVRGKSSSDAPYLDSADWMFLGFHSLCGQPIGYGDSWDVTSGTTQWCVGCSDNTYDPRLSNNGAHGVGRNTGGSHWSSGTANNRTIVWLK